MNNNGYGSIKTSQDRYFEGRRLGTDRSTGLAIPEIQPIVEGFKLRYERINNVHELELVLDRVFSDNTPMIIEVSVDPMQETEPRTFTTILPNGKMQTASMENLHPLLSENILLTELDV